MNNQPNPLYSYHYEKDQPHRTSWYSGFWLPWNPFLRLNSHCPRSVKKLSFTIRFYLVGVMVALMAPSIWAGAWVQPKGHTFTKLSFSQFEADQVFGPKNNKKLPGPDFEDQTLSLYSEYGLSSRWTGIVSIDYKRATVQAGGVESSESGLADSWFYLKRSLKTDPVVLSFQFGAKIPLGYDKLDSPPLGDGQVDLEGRFLVGKSFYPFPGYGNFEVGYRKRNGDVSDEYVYRLESGINIAKPVLLKASLERVESRSNDTASSASNRHPNINDEEFTKVSPGLLFFLKKGWGLELGYESVIAGGNTAVGETISFGIFWQGKP